MANSRTLLCALAVVAVVACSPTVKVDVGVPDKPIHLVIDVNIKQEVLLKVEKDLETVSVAPAIPMAKKGGWIGERPDGYLGQVKGTVPQEISDLVLKINEDRRSRYIKIAKKNKLDLETVESIAGKRFIAKSSSGEYVMNSDENWEKK